MRESLPGFSREICMFFRIPRKWEIFLRLGYLSGNEDMDLSDGAINTLRVLKFYFKKNKF
jgi:hypothetical protein